ncbi:hypothetical protein QJS10_CPA05g02259 [Acorus calamus]|uniref:Riboflavin synthase n=1 Tax=Acorus calamus TaxID=4465 RepID=A0AAV9EWE7_ACOCL|nr:hypothetical protein QJS10_CPA05g02259 [Acorus calamus]
MAISSRSIFSLAKPSKIPPFMSAHPIFTSRTIPQKTHLRFHPNLHSLFNPPKPISSPPNPRRSHARSLFTGIVEEIGEVRHLGGGGEGDGFSMRISAKTVLGGVNLGDSIAVNGTCLTVTDFDHAASEFSVGLSPETLRRTSLGELAPGKPVNLERALTPTTRMGGHFVQGHVDSTGEIVSMVPEGDSLWVKVRAPKELMRFVVPKGFIAVDGTSLTVVSVDDEESCFDFMMVEYTQRKVVIATKKVGEKVNLEVDILGKYVERLIKGG